MTSKMTNPYIIENTLTGEKIFKPMPIDEEVVYDGGVMITETDVRGVITYANRNFREMSGYSKEELIGAPHNIVRHPDMPKGAFRAMWRTIASKKIWRGYVKNLRKDGRYYWVLVYIQPKLDEEGDIIGYTAGRKVAYPEAIAEVSEFYAKYKGDEYIDDPVFSDGTHYHEYLYGQNE